MKAECAGRMKWRMVQIPATCGRLGLVSSTKDILVPRLHTIVACSLKACMHVVIVIVFVSCHDFKLRCSHTCMHAI